MALGIAIIIEAIAATSLVWIAVPIVVSVIEAFCIPIVVAVVVRRAVVALRATRHGARHGYVMGAAADLRPVWRATANGSG
jgi:hypothetical protein